MKQSGSRVRIAAAALFLGSSATLAAAPLQTQQFVGSVGCKSSYCHGGGGEKQGQYLTFGCGRIIATRAYAILVSARSTRMAEALGLKEGATASEKCTVCHSPMHTVSPGGSPDLTNKAYLDEGVLVRIATAQPAVGFAVIPGATGLIPCG